MSYTGTTKYGRFLNIESSKNIFVDSAIISNNKNMQFVGIKESVARFQCISIEGINILYLT